MGVPVLRLERLLGVLVIQNRKRRLYGEEEIETLETFAMALADLLSADDPGSGTEDPARMAPARLTGVAIVAGLAVGHAHLHRRRTLIGRVVAENPQTELARLDNALASMQMRIDRLVDDAARSASGEYVEVLQAYRMFAHDRGWLSRQREAIASGLTAEAAVHQSLNDTRARMGKIVDPYLRERLTDFESLAEDLLDALADASGWQDGATTRPAEPPADAILIARTLGPADLLAYDRARLRGVVLEEGSATAHVTIVARALDIPLIGRAVGILNEAEPGDFIVVDGENAQVFLRPGEEVREQVDRSLRARLTQKARFAIDRDKPCVTRDDTTISLLLNAGLLIDLPQLAATGADGIGLFRTEIPFMTRREFPDVESQYELYQRVLAGAEGKPVAFRALDVGGDKHLQSFSPEQEENPSMGWRSLRILLDRPAILRQQVRALIRASAGHELQIMFPMVSDIGEFDRARHIVGLECARAAERGHAVAASVRVGAMLEIPALVWQLDELVRRVDFISVGSNDLLQFTYAADRSSDRLTARYDALSVPFLRMLRSIGRTCAQAGIPVTVCGEMAGRPLDALALVGLGFRRLSMAATAIGPVKAALRSCHAAEITDFMETVLTSPDVTVRTVLADYAMDHDIITGQEGA